LSAADHRPVPIASGKARIGYEDYLRKLVSAKRPPTRAKRLADVVRAVRG